jgi:type IV secretory pathway VirB10-like protein
MVAMPESKGRKQPPRPHPRPPRKRVVPEPGQPTKSNDPAREIPEERRYRVTELPEPATSDQLLVALSKLDPLAQEVMIAARLAAMPNPTNGPPINIYRGVRGPWAHQLRKLGCFCVPELATHELVAEDQLGMMLNHTGSTLRSIDRTDLWETAKEQNPALGKLVDEAKTPEQKQAAMRMLAAKLPTDIRLAMEKLIATRVEDLEPL